MYNCTCKTKYNRLHKINIKTEIHAHVLYTPKIITTMNLRAGRSCIYQLCVFANLSIGCVGIGTNKLHLQKLHQSPSIQYSIRTGNSKEEYIL